MALEAILAHKRLEVDQRKATASLEGILDRCAPSRRNFRGAVAAGRPGYVMEVKFASPSAGTLRPDRDLEPVLASYRRHADAVSVLTDERFFGGSLARLAAIRQNLEQPLLCKDFLLEPFQVAEARLHGADAILLILAAIDDATWRDCHALAVRLGMAVLTEVHDEAETRRAVALGADLIGINHRDLHTLAIDPGVSARLAPLIPADRLVVAESGIATHADVRRLRAVADGVLVGSALMREPEIDRAVRRLRYGRTKVCGLTTAEDALAAWAAGATHGGLMFAEASPRRVSPAVAATVRAAAPLEWVGVFAGQSPAEVTATATRLGLAAVQLHGEEPPEQVRATRAAVPPHIEVWKAERVRTALPPSRPEGANRLLLDGWSAGRLGGTGTSFDWALLEAHPDREALIVAGGLDPGNAERAAALHPWALDVSSGVESAPGRKSREKMREFLVARARIHGRGDPPQ